LRAPPTTTTQAAHRRMDQQTRQRRAYSLNTTPDRLIRLDRLRPLTGHTDYVLSIAFSPDGRTLASGSADDKIRLWDTRTHQPLGTPLTGHADSVQSVAFSPDGRTLASASIDKTIRLWDTRAHKQLSPPLNGHNDAVNSVAFSPDGRTLASAGNDKTIRLWEKLLWRSSDELRTEVCHFVGGGLSTTEWAQYAAGVPYRRSCP
ncbi:MAG: WD40 repeat domain-containing protein, partial [Solirubrobacteraceae bacterium]